MTKSWQDRSIIAAAGLLAGCASYSPRPITEARVEAALATPTPQELHARLIQLHNPLIHAQDVDVAAPLTPGRAAVLAVLCHPSLRAERARIRLADAQLFAARVLPNPSLSASLDVPVGENTQGEVAGYGIGLEWEVTSLIARRATIDARRASAAQIRLDVAWKEWQVAQAASRAVYDLLAARVKVAEARGLSDQLNRIASAADTALERHEVRLSDAAAVRAAANDAAVTLATAQRELSDAELGLRTAIGVGPDVRLEIEPTLSLPDRWEVPADSVAFDRFPDRRLDLVALRRGYESQEATLRAAVLSQFPRISLGLSHTRDTGDFLTLGPALSAELPFFNHNQGNIAIERATREQLFDEYCSRVFDTRAAIAQAVSTIRSINDLIQAQQHDVDALRQVLKQDEQALHQGNLDVATYFTAAVSLAQKQADLTALRLELVHAWYELELASGAILSPVQPSTRSTEVSR